jgi:nitrite reductase (NADH) small subunit
MAEILVCKVGKMANEAVRIRRAGEVEIGIIRHSGEYYAYRNICPHQGGPACEGIVMPQVEDVVDTEGGWHGQSFGVEDMHIVYPWHGYEFHLADGRHVCTPRVGLQQFPVSVRDGGVYVAI